MDIDNFYYDNQPDGLGSQFLPPSGTYSWRSSDRESDWNDFVKNYKSEPCGKIKEDSVEEFIEYYTKNPIEYKFNSVGFRDDELSTKPKEVDVYLGCSMTSGIGLHQDKIWPSLVSKELNFPSINAGIEGTGVSTQYRTLMYLLKHFKIRNVFHFIPLTHVRWEWWDGVNQKWDGWNSGHPNITLPFSDIENISLQTHVFLKGIAQVCSERNINYYNIVNRPDKRMSNTMIEETARDLKHSGHYMHKMLSKQFLEKINIKNIL